jgi:hypothetical protein
VDGLGPTPLDELRRHGLAVVRREAEPRASQQPAAESWATPAAVVTIRFGYVTSFQPAAAGTWRRSHRW